MQQVVKAVDEQSEQGSKEHLHTVTLKRQIKQILSILTMASHLNTNYLNTNYLKH